MPGKLRLDPENLRVQSFATAGEDGSRGTVLGQVKGACTGNASCPCASGQWACGPHDTSYSCDYTHIGNTCESFPTEVDPSCMC
ncbi:MAG TPA: hypothetical protein VJT67_09940 [Longimicrobiaceae bacterium]|nr:hypothetical protein [Longimicrobiaceae bacterium]